ncbi:MAG: hypothetical protein M1828_003215 [Chrysothrix sp. TS-e1954]|nr:MAG: hypothetical protein M1828_003215 [Chrysothrix sp. TS-e1954]
MPFIRVTYLLGWFLVTQSTSSSPLHIPSGLLSGRPLTLTDLGGNLQNASLLQPSPLRPLNISLLPDTKSPAFQAAATAKVPINYTETELLTAPAAPVDPIDPIVDDSATLQLPGEALHLIGTTNSVAALRNDLTSRQTEVGSNFDVLNPPGGNANVIYVFPGDKVDGVLLTNVLDHLVYELEHIFDERYQNSTEVRLDGKLTLEASTKHQQDFFLSWNGGTYGGVLWADLITYTRMLRQYSATEKRNVTMEYAVEVPGDTALSAYGAFGRGVGP